MHHQDRRRAESFGEDAEAYDRARPTYPPALIADLLAESPHRVLDIGCGTGKAGRLFVDLGCEVVGVEPDGRMARVAGRYGMAVDEATFEGWDPAGRMFDLAVSGQAWHWVDPHVGPHKAAQVLRPGGRLALFWNFGRHDPDTKAAFDEVYGRLAPSLTEDSSPLGTVRRDGGASHLGPLAQTALFEGLEVRAYGWEQRYSRTEWLEQLPTHSDHRLLPGHQLTNLLRAVGEAIDRLGGSIRVSYQTSLITARRR
ncbi:MAG: methyltransferase domain-containing protein [Actinomycetota bacterium]|nr:methyltransferase domain-containing protein [Actinomycetota bacterium]